MPMSSAEIAQMAMMNQQQLALSRALSSAYTQGDVAAGYGLNAAASVGSTAMSLLSSLPMTLGIKAGMSAFSAGTAGGLGFGAAAAGGLSAGLATAGAVALPVAAVGLGAGFVGHQMLEGAQQQQYLNMRLAQSFAFNNQFGLRGFTHQDTSTIGAAMREMTHELGPNGELTSMKELSDLASKMGQMGMMRGVRDAQEFNTKFREMIKTVRTIATELNTSMGQAMEFMQASKASGMFMRADQLRFAQQVQSIATGSGLATSEVAAMGSIGAQISRAYGGLGRQGAFGGMRAIGQVGAALSIGAITEEDIYNATGLTGAEGRQTLAANMMSQTGSFLRSGKGRWFLASLAGANGTIDEAAVQKYLTGAVGVGDTRGMAHSHLGEVGRANFIRNEGRLRGAVMERFGALAPSIALMGWASERGIDINNMDDYTMLFAQRQLGMGRDELDVAVKMAQDLPRIMREQQQQQDYAKYGQRLGLEAKNRGIEGAKRRFEHARERLTSNLQQAGQNMYNDLTDFVDKWLDNWMGTAIPSATEGIQEVWRTSLSGGGGVAGQRSFEALFGGGRVTAATQRLQRVLGTNLPGMSGLTGSRMTWEEFSGESSTASWLLGTGAAASALGGPIGLVPGIGLMAAGGVMKLQGWLGGAGEYRERLERAGYGKRIEAISHMEGRQQQLALNAMLDEANEVQKAVTGNVRTVTVEGSLRMKLLEGYAEHVGKEGLDTRGAAVEKILEQESRAGNKHAAELLQQYRETRSPADKAKMIAGMERSLGIAGGGMRDLGEKLGSLDSATAARMRGMSQAERDQYMGALMRGGEESGGGFWSSVGKGAAVGAAGGLLLGPMAIPGAILGAVVGGASYYLGSGRGSREGRALDEATAKYARSREGMEFLTGIYTGDTSSLEAAYAAITAAQQEGATQEERTKGVAARNALMARELVSAVQKAGVSDVSKLDEKTKEGLLEKYKRYGGEAEDFEHMRMAIAAQKENLYKQWEINRERIAKDMKAAAQEQGGRLEGMGIITYDTKTTTYKLSAETTKKLREQGGQSLAAAMLQMEMLNAEMSGDPERIDEIRAKAEHKYDILSKMSMTQLSSYVKEFGDTDAAVLLSGAKRYRSLSRRGASAALGISGMLGLGGGETRSQKRDLMRAYGQGEEAFIKEYIAQTGVEGEAATRLREALGGKGGIYQQSKQGGKDVEVAIAAALEKLRADPKLKEAIEKKEDARRSPQERDIHNMAADIKTLAQNMKPEAISSSLSTQLTPVLQQIAEKLGQKS